MEMRRIARWLMVAALAALVGSPGAQAGVTVSPARVVLRGKPSATLTGFFTVENPGQEPVDVTVEPEDWATGLHGPRGRPTGWLTVKPSRVRLKPGRGARIKFVVKIPKGASGELRSQVFFAAQIGTDSSMPLRSRLGSIVYVGIEDTERIAGQIRDLQAFYTASTPDVRRPDRLEVVLRIHNEGNAHIIPEGDVVVRDEAGVSRARVTFPEGWGLLPNQDDLYRAIGHGIHLPPGRYRLEATVRCGADLRQPIELTKSLDIELTDSFEVRSLQTPSIAPPAR